MSILKNPVHPGSILKYEFLEPLSMSPYKLAQFVKVPRTRLERLAEEKTSVTPDTALRLGKFFGTTPQFWMNLQTNYEMAKAEAEIDISDITTLDMVS